MFNNIAFCTPHSKSETLQDQLHRWPQGFICPECGHKKYCEIKGRKLYQCHRCHQQTSLTSGTIFAFTKLRLSLWFLGIYLITQSKQGTSSLHLSRSLGISYNAALRMKHKLQYRASSYE